MPFEIIRDDIARVKADAVVNSANPEVAVGRGTDSAIYEAAGFEQLFAERKKIGKIAPGEAAVTKAFALNAKFILHTVGPAWIDGKHGELETLASCYRKCLRLGEQLGCHSIAFPLISTGVYGFPKDKALTIALREIEAFCVDTEDINVILVVYDRAAYTLSSSLNYNVRSFISDRVSEEKKSTPYTGSTIFSNRRKQNRDDMQAYMPMPQPVLLEEAAAPADDNLRDVLKTKSETFQEKLFELIDARGLSDPEVYKRANMDRKLFSKIRSNSDYVPKKKTVFALAVSLKLDYQETADLLQRAGYAFSPASVSDLIIEYCIRKKIYSIFDINAILFEYDQSLL